MTGRQRLFLNASMLAAGAFALLAVYDKRVTLYDATTLAQVAISLVAGFAVMGMLSHQPVVHMPGILRACYLVFLGGLSVNEMWWSIAREAFAGKPWVIALFAAGGLDAKVVMETSPLVLLWKSMIAVGLGGIVYHRLLRPWMR